MLENGTRRGVRNGTRAALAGAAAMALWACGAAGAVGQERAYELVSPVVKNGGEVTANATRTHAAENGGAVMFTSLSGFGEILGTGIGAEYMSRRIGPGVEHEGGWKTHGVTPFQEPLTLPGIATNSEPYFEHQYSEDLDTGVFRAWSPLTDDALVADAFNLYVRRDMLDAGPGTYELVTPCPGCATPLLAFFRVTKPWFAGASTNFQHVLFESVLRLTPEASANNFSTNNVYEWHNGNLRVAGILPDGRTATRSIAGRGISVRAGPRVVSRAISADGSRIAFTVPPNNNVTDGPLYQRINGRATIQLNASERRAADTVQPASYWDASTDQERVFFTTVESLTEDAPVSTDTKAYMWERQPTNERQDVTVDATGGTFTLRFHGAATASVAFDASPDTVERALEELVTVGHGNVAVNGGPGGPGGGTPYTVEFTGDFAGANVADLTADGASLTGGAGTATVETTSPVANLTFLSRDSEGPNSANVEGIIGVSEDGDYVYFAAAGQLVAGEPALGSRVGIYLWHDGTLRYVGEHAAFSDDRTDILDLTTAVVSRKQSRVTQDGRHLLLSSTLGDGLLEAHGGRDYDHGRCADSGAGIGGTCRELYVYSADADELRCASCNPSGAPATASAIAAVRATSGASSSTAYLNRPISHDGRYVFFSTGEALVPADVNGRIDAYQFNTQSGKPTLISSGTHPSDSYFMDASASGEDVFFVTREQLVGWDIDQGYDLYDARIGGGFPEPIAPTAGCSGDACQGALAGAPAAVAAGSAGVRGTGNANEQLEPRSRARDKRTKAKRCKRGKKRKRVRGKTRCVKKKASRKARRGKQAKRCVRGKKRKRAHGKAKCLKRKASREARRGNRASSTRRTR